MDDARFQDLKWWTQRRVDLARQLQRPGCSTETAPPDYAAFGKEGARVRRAYTRIRMTVTERAAYQRGQAASRQRMAKARVLLQAVLRSLQP